MNQTTFEPPSELQNHVKCFWTLEQAQDTYNQYAIMPDSYAEVVIRIGAPLILETPDRAPITLPQAYFCPLQKSPHSLRAEGPCAIIAMRVYPWALPSLVDVNMVQSNHPFVALNRTWQTFARELEITAYNRGFDEALACLQQFVSEQFRNALRDAALAQKLGQQIYASRGRLNIRELGEQYFLSPSYFERLFKHFTGVTPKTYARLIRFESICNTLVLNPSRGLTTLAHEFGYTDQAHFIHDFKALAVCTPGKFVEQIKAYTADWKPDDFLQFA